MRKMKRLFKARNRFMPWYHWSTINFWLNGLSIIALFITVFFSDNKPLMIYWLQACISQWIPIFLFQIVALIFTRKLSNTVLNVIKAKLEESKSDFKQVELNVTNRKLYACTIVAVKGIDTIKKVNEICDIVDKMNQKFGNNYIVNCVVSSDNAK